MSSRTDMMAAHSHDHEFDRLVSVLLAGDMSLREHEQLEHLLKKYPQLIDRYLEMTGLHLDLKRLASHPENSVIGPRPCPIERRWLHRGTIVVTAIVASLAMIVLAFLGTSENHLQRDAASDHEPPAIMALGDPCESLPIVAESASAKIYGRGFAPRPGESVTMREEHILTRGSLVLKFPSGAEAILTAPCVFMAVDRETLLLKTGQCSVHAPPGAEGFRVTTPSASVVDLGTRFAVGVDITGKTALHVVDGAATFASNVFAGVEPILLHEGESAFIDQIFPPTLEIPAEHQISYIDELPDRVVHYEATSDEHGLAEELLTLTVQRDGQIISYGRDELVPARLVDFSGKAGTAIFCTRRGDSLPERDERLGLLTDWSLVTGVINPAPSFDRISPEAPVGMEVEFNPPVVNGPGPDIVLFDLHLLVNAESGDNVRISTPASRERNQTIEITQFDLDLSSPDALDLSFFQVYSGDVAVQSVSDIITCPAKTREQTFVRAKGLATGIDLSDLGYQPGEAARRMTLEDDTDDHQCIDPVLIVALPPMEE